MLQSTFLLNNKEKKQKQANGSPCLSQIEKIALMGRTSNSLINELYSPIDAINRFINLALQGLEEDSQSRQFLLESKKGVRKTSALLKKLNHYLKQIEEEIRKI